MYLFVRVNVAYIIKRFLGGQGRTAGQQLTMPKRLQKMKNSMVKCRHGDYYENMKFTKEMYQAHKVIFLLVLLYLICIVLRCDLMVVVVVFSSLVYFLLTCLVFGLYSKILTLSWCFTTVCRETCYNIYLSCSDISQGFLGA